MTLEAALQALGEAHGPKALRAAFGRLQGLVTRQRKASGGVLAQTFGEAMAVWAAQKIEGVSLEDRVDGLEKSLRSAWPQVREWKFLCAECADTGYQIVVCGRDYHCGRPKKRSGDDWTGAGKCRPGHAFAVPCFCDKGRSMVPKPKTPGDFTEAGRSPKKPSGFARVGR